MYYNVFNNNLIWQAARQNAILQLKKKRDSSDKERKKEKESK